MKRGYTALEFKDKVRRLRAVRPDISISSDFIVGFPGETERDFEATLALVREVGFDQSFSFLYSRRPGTPAASLPDEVAARGEAGAPRAAAGAARGAGARHQRGAWSAACSACWSSAPRRRMRASSPGAPRTTAGSTSPDPPRLIGRFVDVTVTEALAHSLRGRLPTAPRAAAPASPRTPRPAAERQWPHLRRAAARIRSRAARQRAAREPVRPAR